MPRDVHARHVTIAFARGNHDALIVKILRVANRQLPTSTVRTRTNQDTMTLGPVHSDAVGYRYSLQL